MRFAPYILVAALLLAGCGQAPAPLSAQVAANTLAAQGDVNQNGRIRAFYALQQQYKDLKAYVGNGYWADPYLKDFQELVMAMANTRTDDALLFLTEEMSALSWQNDYQRVRKTILVKAIGVIARPASTCNTGLESLEAAKSCTLERQHTAAALKQAREGAPADVRDMIDQVLAEIE